MTRDELTGDIRLNPVVRVFVTEDQPLFRIELESPDGTSEQILATPNHPFWTRDRGWRWTEAADLSAGQVLVNAHGAELLVRSLERAAVKRTVYNFEVESTHSYFVGRGRVWVHNKCADAKKDDGQNGGEEFARGGPPKSLDLATIFLTQVRPVHIRLSALELGATESPILKAQPSTRTGISSAERM